MNLLPSLRATAPGVTRGIVRTGADTEIPYVVVKGRVDGPRLCVTAGVHGSEYCAIEAAQRLMLTPHTSIRGTLTILPIVNQQGFTARSIYIVPADGKNLNRLFPGRIDGSKSERLAHWLVNQVIARSDAYLDLHCGDLNEALIPFSIFCQGHTASQKLAQIFGLPIAVASLATGMTISAATALGIPAIIAEAGGNGLRDEKAIDLLIAGTYRVMEALGMRTDVEALTVLPVSHEVRTCGWSVLQAPTSGLWYPVDTVGHDIAAGKVVGIIRNAFGDEQVIIRSPVDGQILFQLTSLATNTGEALAGIGHASTPQPRHSFVMPSGRSARSEAHHG